MVNNRSGCATQFPIIRPAAQPRRRVVSCNSTVNCSETFPPRPSLPSPTLSERRRYCIAGRHAVCVCVSAVPRLHAALVTAAKVMRCIQCCLVTNCYFNEQINYQWMRTSYTIAILRYASASRGKRMGSITACHCRGTTAATRYKLPAGIDVSKWFLYGLTLDIMAMSI